MLPKWVAIFCLALASFSGLEAQEPYRVLPTPSDLQAGSGYLVVDSSFRVSMEGYSDAIIQNAAVRLARNLKAKTGLQLALEPIGEGKPATLRIRCGGADPYFLTPQANESYQLSVTPQGAVLSAPGPTGILRGMATFFQLVRVDAVGFRTPAVTITDQPRFAWRGLMLDVARHFLTVDTLKRNLDAMELVKMNVLELHLSDAEGFRVESKLYPKLTGSGSGGEYYTQKEVRELVAYARDRGIRVVPEFDMPGHSKAMLVGYPELASLPGPYVMGPDRNVDLATLDPTREETYQFLSRFVEEMSTLFPDRYFHTGGDEVNGAQWAQNSKIQAFMKEHGFKDKTDLQAYFTERVRKILAKNGKTMIGWDEVLQPKLAKDVVVQAWRSSKMVQRSAAMGHATLVSAGYYLDYELPAGEHYAVDPYDSRAQGLPLEALQLVKGTPFADYVTDENIAADSPLLTPEQGKLVDGGIACMWTEFVWDEKEEMEVWPRVAAVAERLWSAAKVKDQGSLYLRLRGVDSDLELLGLRHHSNEIVMLQRLAGDQSVVPLATLAEAVEPIKNLARYGPLAQAGIASGKGIDNTLVTTRFVDAVPPESMVAQKFRESVRKMLAEGSGSEKLRQEVRAKLVQWRDNDLRFESIAKDSFLLKEVIPASQDLKELTEAGLAALTMWESKQAPTAEWLEKQRGLLARHQKITEASANQLTAMMSPQPAHELINVIAPAIADLVSAAAAVR